MSRKPDTSAVRPEKTSEGLWMDGIGTLNKTQTMFVYGCAFATGGLIGLAFCHVDCGYQKFVYAMAELVGRPFGVFEPKEKNKALDKRLTGATNGEDTAELLQTPSEMQRAADIQMRRLQHYTK